MMRIVVAEFAVDVEISQDRYVVAIVVVATIDVVDSLDALLVLLGAVGTVNLPYVSNMHVTAAQGQAQLWMELMVIIILNWVELDPVRGLQRLMALVSMLIVVEAGPFRHQTQYLLVRPTYRRRFRLCFEPLRQTPCDVFQALTGALVSFAWP